MTVNQMSSDALWGAVGSIVLAVLGGIGAWWRLRDNHQQTGEERYEDGLWKTITLLTQKNETQEKRIGDLDKEIIGLREESFGLRKQLYETNALLTVARNELDHAHQQHHDQGEKGKTDNAQSY